MDTKHFRAAKRRIAQRACGTDDGMLLAEERQGLGIVAAVYAALETEECLDACATVLTARGWAPED